MSERPDWRISSLLHASVERFEDHTKRIGSILDRAQEKFERDHSSAVGGVGSVLLLGSMALAFWKEQWIVSSIGLVLGTGLLLAALVVRHKSAVSQVRYANTMVELERERARFQQRTVVLNHIWLHGLPEGTPLAQIQVLLGDSPGHSPQAAATTAAAWKALPAQGDHES